MIAKVIGLGALFASVILAIPSFAPHEIEVHPLMLCKTF